ncbi:GNAT family N-acetyltransferase [Nodosilinea sp. P-1105]|uniref:GNAT family N-acetyltransferase n=1 Tax=Nodosilinea sp. P-1105 TaxID=2546229 RepID=UPI00146F8E9C|nr:GNAT family N-acetyltransferase [Nodosilinea sp. P-1105]NMF84563.1 GNAT family N-acetyltransferase [Nodosilinea sp. P-1105]
MATIRQATAADLQELATLYRQTVLTHAPHYYTPAQTTVWAEAADAESFHPLILAVTTYLAVDDSGIVGFAGLGADGHVASVYVRHDRVHQGIGSRLLQTILDQAQRQALPRLYAEASELSLGLFKKFGFRCYDTEVAHRSGVLFKRYLVERYLG